MWWIKQKHSKFKSEDMKRISQHLRKIADFGYITDIQDELLSKAAALFKGAFWIKGEFLNMFLDITIKQSVYNDFFMSSFPERLL